MGVAFSWQFICLSQQVNLVPEYHRNYTLFRMLRADNLNLLYKLFRITIQVGGTIKRHSIFIHILLIPVDASGRTQVTYNQIIHDMLYMVKNYMLTINIVSCSMNNKLKPSKHIRMDPSHSAPKTHFSHGMVHVRSLPQ